MQQLKQQGLYRNRLWCQGLLAAEGQQLLDQPGGTLAVVANLDNVGKQIIARPNPFQQQITMAQRCCQNIVEIMGYPTGQLAQGL